MPTTFNYLGFPFDSELFNPMWKDAPDPILTAMYESGVVVDDAVITGMISGGGNFYTIPFYNPLEGAPTNIDGQTDINVHDTKGSSQSGIVFTRGEAFREINFTSALSGNDPQGFIARKIGEYWNRYRQKTILRILNGIFTNTDTSADSPTRGWSAAFRAGGSHVLDTGAAIGVTDANEIMTNALGDNKNQFAMVWMHSKVAKRLENLRVLDFWRNTNQEAVSTDWNLRRWGNLLVVIDDGVPVDGTKYTTYFLGNGTIRRALGNMGNLVPSEVLRRVLENGGEDILTTRIRETFHVNGTSFIVPSTNWTNSPTEAQLGAGANWKAIYTPKAIPVAKLVTDEAVI
jgi:hypothetical protein